MATLEQTDNLVISTLCSGVTLTTSYQEVARVGVDGANLLILQIAFTKGSSTGFRLMLERSLDNVTYYQEAEQSQAGGVTSYVPNEREVQAAGNLNITFDIPVSCRSIRISARALTSGTGTSLTIIGGRAYV